MRLYTTQLQIDRTTVPYLVSMEGGRLLFRPCSATEIDAPIFWVSKESGEWKPININDDVLVQQILDGIQDKGLG